MPPKRKRTDNISAGDGSTSTRATRSSSRVTNGTTQNVSEGGTNGLTTTESGEGDGMEAPPPTKKSRVKSATKSTATRAAKAKDKQVSTNATSSVPVSTDDESSVAKKTHDDPEPNKTHPTQAFVPTSTTASTPKAVAPLRNDLPPPTTESYTPERSLSLFKTYVDSDDPEVIGPEGFEKLCNDAKFPLDGPLPLILAWQLGAKEMAKITRSEWMSGAELMKCASLYQFSMAITDLEGLLILNKSPTKKSTKKEPYDKTTYWKYCENKKAAFQKLYMFCFTLAKPEQSRNIEMETAVALWSVLLVPKYPIMSEVLGFINEKGSYKATNKDLWTMMLEFCETVNPNLTDYEGEGAWPTLLDDFVLWKKASAGNEVAD